MTPSWLIDLPSCDSTNTWALTHSSALAHGSCIFTAHQTAGRGQPGNQWYAPPGVLTASLILDLTGDAQATQLALAAGLAVAHATEDFVPGVRVLLKWPNDCLIHGRKLAGILCEQTTPALDRVVIGIGLNLDPHWDQCPEALPLASDPRWPPTSLAEYTRHPPTPIDLLAKIRQYLIEAAGLMAAGGWVRLLPEILARDALRDQALHLNLGTAPICGTGAGIDASGRLLIQTKSGIQAIASARAISLIAE